MPSTLASFKLSPLCNPNLKSFQRAARRVPTHREDSSIPTTQPKAKTHKEKKALTTCPSDLTQGWVIFIFLALQKAGNLKARLPGLSGGNKTLKWLFLPPQPLDCRLSCAPNPAPGMNELRSPSSALPALLQPLVINLSQNNLPARQILV